MFSKVIERIYTVYNLVYCTKSPVCEYDIMAHCGNGYEIHMTCVFFCISARDRKALILQTTMGDVEMRLNWQRRASCDLDLRQTGVFLASSQIVCCRLLTDSQRMSVPY